MDTPQADQIKSIIDYASYAKAEQAFEREMAIRAAMIESMGNLALDEQYVASLLLARLRELRGQSDTLVLSPFRGVDVHLAIAPFMRRCLVGQTEASARLEAAARSLYSRTIFASYPSEYGQSREMKHHACWFDSLKMHEGEITLHLSSEATRHLLMAAAAAPDTPEESASMISEFLAAA